MNPVSPADLILILQSRLEGAGLKATQAALASQFLLKTKVVTCGTLFDVESTDSPAVLDLVAPEVEQLKAENKKLVAKVMSLKAERAELKKLIASIYDAGNG